MYRLSGTIRLIAPLLYNKPSTSTIQRADQHVDGGRKTTKEKIDEAGAKVHADASGVLVVPQEMFKRSIIQGAKLANLKWGRRSLAQYLEAVLFVEQPLSFGCKKPDLIHEHWGKIPPRTGAMVLIRRPLMKDGRTLDFRIAIFDDAIKPDVVKAAIESAGLYSGMGAWRPQFGRFVVDSCAQVGENGTPKRRQGRKQNPSD